MAAAANSCGTATVLPHPETGSSQLLLPVLRTGWKKTQCGCGCHRALTCVSGSCLTHTLQLVPRAHYSVMQAAPHPAAAAGSCHARRCTAQAGWGSSPAACQLSAAVANSSAAPHTSHFGSYMGSLWLLPVLETLSDFLAVACSSAAAAITRSICLLPTLLLLLTHPMHASVSHRLARAPAPQHVS
jgi:hypothetical protein